MLVSAAVGLLAVVGVFILGDLHSTPAAGQVGPAAPPPLDASPQAPPSSSGQATEASDPVPAPETAAPAVSPLPARAAAAAVPLAAPAAASKASLLSRTSILLSDSEAPFDITSRTEDPPTSDRASYVSWMLAHSDEKEKFLVQKWALAQSMVSLRSLTHPRVLAAVLRAPREFFCRDARRAYEDAVLPIGYGQTISGPHMVARMTDYLDPQPDQRVLEIGTGSGYQSSVLAELSNHVYTVEIVEPLARETDAIYRAREARYPEYRNIHRRIADGYYGWPENAPFDRIIVTCGIDHVPPELLRELAPEGIMVIPVGPPSGQTILRIVKHVAPDGTVTLDREDIFHGKKRQIFVPFRSGQGGVHVFEDKKEVK
jgi:protein-L-isoaspartate(D-aspartate) O-methyltransferase